MNRRGYKFKFSIIGIIASVLVYILSLFTPGQTPINVNKVKVLKVIDGDTLKVLYNNKEERVRMLGIDTPESVHPDESKNTLMGITASKYTKKLLSSKTVKLEFEKEKRDKYNRLLAYVWLDDELINLKLVTDGYARTFMLKKNSKYYQDFMTAEKHARDNKIGIWSE